VDSKAQSYFDWLNQNSHWVWSSFSAGYDKTSGVTAVRPTTTRLTNVQ
jgi:hypothetical protein